MGSENTENGELPGRCLNCRTRLVSNFCAICGQAATVERYTLGSFVREIYKKFHSVDALSTLRTFLSLTFNPGKFVNLYLRGKRVGYTAPITYFFYFFVLEVTVRWVLHALTGNDDLGNASSDNLRTQLLTLASTVFWGGLWWIFYRSSPLNLTESVIAAIYFVAHLNLLSIFFLVAGAPFATKYPIVSNITAFAEIFLALFYGIFFCRRLYREPYWKLVPKQFVLTIIFLFITLAVISIGDAATQTIETIVPTAEVR